ncbi:hypothetical protein [Bosea lathyri]|uniref:Uncharacterized protein n=1 Tax=Bosea lathyri TaxID=1036778 RepID=A0A1H6BG85_9HYPH|nr:hypothetical protein [Bosea lathyri]SEG59357.1 hypothetical protein SAMN04488115_107192 [Bosea lathyri]
MADLPPPDFLHQLVGVKVVNVVSGVAGGLVRGLIAKGFSWPQRLSSAMVGGLTAGYATPAAMPIIRKWLDLWSYPTGDIEGSVGFALGLVGMTICDALIRWARRWRDGAPPFTPPRSGASSP